MMRAIASLIVLFSLFGVCRGQETQWTVVNGKARLQTVITVPQKDAAYLYKQISRWLIATFENPEDVLKARIESEYLKGEAYHSKIVTRGPLNSVNFKYTFSLEIKDEKVRFTFSNGLLIYDLAEDNSKGVYPIESYFKHPEKKKKDQNAENVLASVNTLSGSLVRSLEDYLLTQHEQEDW